MHDDALPINIFVTRLYCTLLQLNNIPLHTHNSVILFLTVSIPKCTSDLTVLVLFSTTVLNTVTDPYYVTSSLGMSYSKVINIKYQPFIVAGPSKQRPTLVHWPLQRDREIRITSPIIVFAIWLPSLPSNISPTLYLLFLLSSFISPLLYLQLCPCSGILRIFNFCITIWEWCGELKPTKTRVVWCSWDFVFDLNALVKAIVERIDLEEIIRYEFHYWWGLAHQFRITVVCQPI